MAEAIVGAHPTGAAFSVGARPHTYIARPGAEGPWSPGYCHGGAPAALVVEAASAVPTIVPMSIARLTLDLMRPVPLGELRVDVRVVRDGKKVQLVEVGLSAGGEAVARGTVLKLRKAAGPAFGPQRFDMPGPDQGATTVPPSSRGFAGMFTMVAVRGLFEEIGPAGLWFRLDGEVVEGRAVHPCALAVASADYGIGISAVLPFDAWLYPNTDLTVSFIREPVGPWILVDAETSPGSEGRGVTHARLADAHGWFGHSLQIPLFEKRPDR